MKTRLKREHSDKIVGMQVSSVACSCIFLTVCCKQEDDGLIVSRCCITVWFLCTMQEWLERDLGQSLK